MQKPDVIALPTSQMMAFCDVLGLGDKVQDSTGSMIAALESADFGKLKKGETHGFDPDKVEASIVAKRKAALGR